MPVGSLAGLLDVAKGSVPFEPIGQTYEAIRTQEVDLSQEAECRRWFNHQISYRKSLPTTKSGFMVYAGFETGLFSGFMLNEGEDGLLTVYTARNTGSSQPGSFETFPRPTTSWPRDDSSTAWETSPCAQGVTCRPHAPSHGCDASPTW